jgi:hypothetical protein
MEKGFRQISSQSRGVQLGGQQMKLLAKILGSIIGAILYPIFWMLEWVLLFVAAIFETLENLMGEETDEKR